MNISTNQPLTHQTLGHGQIWMTRLLICFIALASYLPAQAGGQKPGNKFFTLVYQKEASGRIAFGAKKLSNTLEEEGYQVKLIGLDTAASRFDVQKKNVIYIGTGNQAFIQVAIRQKDLNPAGDTAAEGFTLQSSSHQYLVISGTDHSGVLYGCLELADRIKSAAKAGRQSPLASTWYFRDQPQMTLRGTCIGMQKPYMLPGRGTYEYPYTKELFPWFYNKELWIQYLDMLVENRMNTLYLWAGHPFASLVRLKDYPDAVEVDSANFAANQQMFKFLTTEANKRGIWVIQSFYNIIVSKPFAEKHHMKTQDRNRPIIPVIADYTRKSIAAFVEQYPNVGLLVTLGEAMEGVGPDDTEWFTKTIIPGVQDGLKALGQTKEPPIILRAHDADAPAIMKASKPIYSNLYTMAKYNGEALTTYAPRGPWAELHRKLSSIAPVQVENVHILANLEPFRYGADDFIRKSVQAMHKIYGSNGLHLYPQASYWDWPYSADKTNPRLLQVDRDWIWYAEWARYAWNCDRDSASEKAYWAGRVAEKYGADLATGQAIMTAYEASGEIAPKLLRRYGITDGNRQTLSLGMLMSQLINPKKYGLFTLLYTSEAPPGEMITEYAKKEWLHEAHTGETPVQIAREVVAHAKKAVNAIQKAAPGIHQDQAEFQRLKNDMISYQHLADFYSQKAMAALKVLRYGYSHNSSDLDAALPLLEASVQSFKALAKTADKGYLYANSLQTGARKIPMTGKDGQYKTWAGMLVVYEEELADFKKNIQHLKSRQPGPSGPAVADFIPATVTWTDPSAVKHYSVDKGGQPFSDTTVTLDTAFGSLMKMSGIQVDREKQITSGTRLSFTTDRPVVLLAGFFTGKNKRYLKQPELETDASANDYGQAATKIANAMVLPGYPGVNVHTYRFGKGAHELLLGKGECLLLGFIQDTGELNAIDAGLGTADMRPDLDWLFQ